ncbi:MAG: type I-C CRISPR-associated protein Cas7/Csd2 [Thermodesulfobacteriota bacterium]
MSSITNRHDILILFDVANGNPNGDPDAGNMPRIDPNTGKGIVSDVCLKRKVRNYVEMFPPTGSAENGNLFNILIRQGAVINKQIGKGLEEAKKVSPSSKEDQQRKVKEWLCRNFFDVRTFGGVLSTGDDVMKGSAHGQVRGPVQFTFGQSYHPITPLEITITRCAVTKEEDVGKERTMGRKHIVPYALYSAKCYISPVFADADRGTGFTEEDLDVFFRALTDMFTHDHSAARGEMTIRGIYDFEHVGTQHPNNAEQNKREARLGCCHAHKLFDGIQVKLREGRELPESYGDYDITCLWEEEALPTGVRLHLRHEQPIRTICPAL